MLEVSIKIALRKYEQPMRNQGRWERQHQTETGLVEFILWIYKMLNMRTEQVMLICRIFIIVYYVLAKMINCVSLVSVWKLMFLFIFGFSAKQMMHFFNSSIKKWWYQSKCGRIFCLLNQKDIKAGWILFRRTKDSNLTLATVAVHLRLNSMDACIREVL